MAAQTPKLGLNVVERGDHIYSELLGQNARKLDNAVMDTRKVNGKPLSSDVILQPSDLHLSAMTNTDIDAIINS